MRISTTAAFQKSVFNLQERKRKLDEAQEHISGQKRVLRASDDPVAAARAERARAQIAASDSQERSLQASRNAMTQADSALGNASELLTEARSTLIGAGNGILTDADRNNLTLKLQNVRDQLLTLANQGDGSGNYVFGGQGASTPPFSETAGQVVFNGSTGEQSTAGAEALPLTVNGAAAWLQAADANGQPNQSVFDTLDKAIEELRTPGRTSAQVAQTVQDGLGGLSRSADALSALRTRVGEALVHVDQAEARNGTAKYQAQVVRSEAEDLDTVAALADMQLQSTHYEVALKTYSMVQKLSIFNHIG